MEGVLRRRAAAIVQQKDGWYGLTFTTEEREIGELNLYSDRSLPELRRIVDGTGYGIALENGSAFLFNLTFPFSDKAKIRLVIRSELEQRLPVSVEDMEVSFAASGKGQVLAAAVPKTLADDLHQDRQVRLTTVQSIAALYALKWFRLVAEHDFVFIHMNRNATVVMAFKGSDLYSLRQFFHSPQSNALTEALFQITEDKDFTPESYFMIGDTEEADTERVRLESDFHIKIQTPSLRQTLSNSDVPEWSWAGVGAALMAIRPRGHLNLSGRGNRYPFISSKAGSYACAGLACLGLVACGMSYLDYRMKERVYTYLAAEPARIYKSTFPKSPPIRDPIMMFREKIKAFEKEPGSITAIASPLVILNELSSRVPPELDVKINEFSSDEKEFAISGTTVSFGAVEKIRDSIQEMKGVSRVEAQNLELTSNKQVRFKLKGRL
jgi:hypothetical protein